MSGGSFDYKFREIENTYVGHMHDRELNEMIQDLADLLHDLEWYISGDYDEDTYVQSIKIFKQKWLGGTTNRTKRLKEIIEESCDDLRSDLIRMVQSYEEH